MSFQVLVQDATCTQPHAICLSTFSAALNVEFTFGRYMNYSCSSLLNVYISQQGRITTATVWTTTIEYCSVYPEKPTYYHDPN